MSHLSFFACSTLLLVGGCLHINWSSVPVHFLKNAGSHSEGNHHLEVFRSFSNIIFLIQSGRVRCEESGIELQNVLQDFWSISW